MRIEPKKIWMSLLALVAGAMSVQASAYVTGSTTFANDTAGEPDLVMAICVTGSNSPGDFAIFNLMKTRCDFTSFMWSDERTWFFNQDYVALEVQSGWYELQNWSSYSAEGGHWLIATGSSVEDYTTSNDSCTTWWGACT